MIAPAHVKLRELLPRYEAILLDAYGVLVDGEGPLPGAQALVAELREANRPHFVVTNDASRLPETVARRMAGFGIELSAEQVITSGSLLAAYFLERGLEGARTLVLGTDDSRRYVEMAGGLVVPPAPGQDYDAIVACDDASYPFLETMDIALSALYRQLDRGDEVALILPNPDLVYPKHDGGFGFTAGAAALLLDTALARRYPRRDLAFARLGKPHPPMFIEAKRRAGTERLLMIGDQLETDIAGARAAGIDAALVTTGVTRWDEAAPAAGAMPNFLLSGLEH